MKKTERTSALRPWYRHAESDRGPWILGDMSTATVVDRPTAHMILDYQQADSTALPLKAADVSGDGVIDSSGRRADLEYAAEL